MKLIDPPTCQFEVGVASPNRGPPLDVTTPNQLVPEVLLGSLTNFSFLLRGFAASLVVCWLRCVLVFLSVTAPAAGAVSMSLADQQWSPTSVQVTVLQARGLRIKGKSGTNDAYAVMQVGKEKYQTSVVEKSVAPAWKEEASFDLPPLLLQAGGGGGKDRSTLHVQVLHRALVGPDKLLGQAVINLLQLSEDKTRNKTE